MADACHPTEFPIDTNGDFQDQKMDEDDVWDPQLWESWSRGVDEAIRGLGTEIQALLDRSPTADFSVQPMVEHLEGHLNALFESLRAQLFLDLDGTQKKCTLNHFLSRKKLVIYFMPSRMKFF